MKLCPECDPPAICCDHCMNYDFNADSEGRYTGAGWCRLHQRSEDPGSECDDFECFRLNIGGVAE